SGAAAAVANSVEKFLDSQLGMPITPGVIYDRNRDITSVGNRVKPVRIKWMQPTDGHSVASTGTRDLFDPDAANPSTITTRKNVYLWRNLEPVNGAQAGRADRSRHVLADRLRDPGVANSARATLDRRRSATASQDVDN